MLLSSTRLAAAAFVLLATAGVAVAQVSLQFADGRVTLSAQNVPARTILAEWARLGGTTIVNGDRVVGGALTLELAGVTERQALDIILREVPGYMLALRDDAAPGQSRFGRIMVVPVTATPRPAASTAFSNPPPPAFSSSPSNQDDFTVAERAEQEAARRAEELAQRTREAADTLRRLTEQQQNRANIVSPGVVTTAPPPFAGSEFQQRPVTPQPPGPTPGNPFMPTAGSATPGTIAPVPPQQQQQQQQNQPRPVQ